MTKSTIPNKLIWCKKCGHVPDQYIEPGKIPILVQVDCLNCGKCKEKKISEGIILRKCYYIWKVKIKVKVK